MKKLAAILMINLLLSTTIHAAFVVQPQLSVSHTLIDPGESTTLTAVFYTDQPEKHLAVVKAPSGFTVNKPEQDTFSDGIKGDLHNWIVTADPKLHYGRYTFELWIDGTLTDVISIDVRIVGTWVHLPFVMNSTKLVP